MPDPQRGNATAEEQRQLLEAADLADYIVDLLAKAGVVCNGKALLAVLYVAGTTAKRLGISRQVFLDTASVAFKLMAELPLQPEDP